MSAVDPLLAPEFGDSALLVSDMQRDFAEGGASPIAGTAAVVPAVARLVAAYRETGRPVIHAIRPYTGDDVNLVRRRAIADGAPIVRPGTPGSQVIANLLPAGAPALDPGLLLAGAPQVIGSTRWCCGSRGGARSTAAAWTRTWPASASRRW